MKMFHSEIKSLETYATLCIMSLQDERRINNKIYSLYKWAHLVKLRRLLQVFHSKYLVAMEDVEGSLNKLPCASVPKCVLLTEITLLMFSCLEQSLRFYNNRYNLMIIKLLYIYFHKNATPTSRRKCASSLGLCKQETTS